MRLSNRVLLKTFCKYIVSLVLFGGILCAIVFYSYQKSFFVDVYADHGLGNQMFQYAANYAYAKKMNKNACRLPSTESLAKIYNLSIPSCNIFDQFLHHFVKDSCYVERYIDANIWSYNCHKLNGFFQNEDFFVEYKSDIINEFSINLNDQQIFQNMAHASNLMKNIRSENSICLHFRRSDYISHGYPILPPIYYENAINYIKSKDNKKVKLFVFSDDMMWVKNNFKTDEDIMFVEGNEGFVDMYLMSQCKYNINANSTFSWWGAYRNLNPNNIVIVPNIWDYWHSWWVEDIIPQGWVMMPSFLY